MRLFRRFKNRNRAGALLARRLSSYAGRAELIVLALPRGGVPVGAAIARQLQAPLDVIVVRKIGLPQQPDFALGAVAGDGTCLLQAGVIAALGVPPAVLEEIAVRERALAAQRQALYRCGRPPPTLRNKVVILVDDGIATGATMKMALSHVRQALPARVIIAVPVAPPAALRTLTGAADEIICLRAPPDFHAVSQYYRDFDQVDDAEVVRLLASCLRAPPG
jgi:putative phosphoribosyl transferase